MLVERQALEELHEVNNHQEELGGSGYSSLETPNRQTQMNKKERRKYPSLRSFTWSENSEKSEGQLLVENTVQEWYNAKHATSSVAEIEFINSLDINNVHSVDLLILQSMGIRKTEHKDIFVKDVVNASRL